VSESKTRERSKESMPPFSDSLDRDRPHDFSQLNRTVMGGIPNFAADPLVCSKQGWFHAVAARSEVDDVATDADASGQVCPVMVVVKKDISGILR
jgi:hypothetical protein